MSFDLVLFEPVRSAEPPMVSGTAALITSSGILGGVAGGDPGRVFRQFLFVGGDSLVKVGGQRTGHDARELSLVGGTGKALLPILAQ